MKICYIVLRVSVAYLLTIIVPFVSNRVKLFFTSQLHLQENCLGHIYM